MLPLGEPGAGPGRPGLVRVFLQSTNVDRLSLLLSIYKISSSKVIVKNILRLAKVICSGFVF